MKARSLQFLAASFAVLMAAPVLAADGSSSQDSQGSMSSSDGSSAGMSSSDTSTTTTTHKKHKHKGAQPGTSGYATPGASQGMDTSSQQPGVMASPTMGGSQSDTSGQQSGVSGSSDMSSGSSSSGSGSSGS